MCAPNAKQARRTGAVSSDAEGTVRKRMFLITDRGFPRQLALNLFCMAACVVTVLCTPALYRIAYDLYGDINDRMMATAHRMAWWSLLGLLSSSCCALQLLLNALSFGCAGFNSILGPVRPTCVAGTITVQALTWYVAWPRPWQWAPTAAATGLVLGLTLLPEALAAHTALRGRVRARRRTTLSLQDGEKSTTLRFRLDNVGCAACVSTVSRILDDLPGVTDHDVSLKDGIAAVRLIPDHDRTEGKDSKSQTQNQEQEILNKLEDAGFPVVPLDANSNDESKKDM